MTSLCEEYFHFLYFKYILMLTDYLYLCIVPCKFFYFYFWVAAFCLCSQGPPKSTQNERFHRAALSKTSEYFFHHWLCDAFWIRQMAYEILDSPALQSQNTVNICQNWIMTIMWLFGFYRTKDCYSLEMHNFCEFWSGYKIEPQYNLKCSR